MQISTAVSLPSIGKVTYAALGGKFIADEILPYMPVETRTGAYTTIPKGATIETGPTRRAPNGAYQRSTFLYGEAQYSCQEEGKEEPMDDVRVLEAGRMFGNGAFGVRAFCARRAMDYVMRCREKRLADYYINTTTMTGQTQSLTTAWATVASANPPVDVKTAQKSIYDRCGVLADTLVVSRDVRANLNVTAAIVDRVKYTNPAVSLLNLPDELVAQALGVRKLLVGDAKYNSANEGLTVTLGNIWSSSYAFLFKQGDGPDLTEPQLGRTFLWTQDSPVPYVTEQYREESVRGDVLRVRQHIDEVDICLEAAQLIAISA